MSLRGSKLATGVLAATLALAPSGRGAVAIEPSIRQPQPNGLALVITRDERKSGDLRVAILAADWLYCDPATKQVHQVPVGYMTDFASIPPFARLFFSQFGEWAEAAVIHDYLYALALPGPGRRAEADRIFLTAMREQGVGPIRGAIMYRAVRLGGGRGYGGEREWTERWGDPLTGQPIPAAQAPPKPPTSVIAVVADCKALETQAVRDQLLAQARSQPATRAAGDPP